MRITCTRTTAVNTKDEEFFKAMGARIAQGRKQQGLTQSQLAEQLGIAQQTLAHYEVGRLRVPASMLPVLSAALSMDIEALLGQTQARTSAKRGPASRLAQQVERIGQLPMAKQRFVMEMLDTVLAQAGR